MPELKDEFDNQDFEQETDETVEVEEEETEETPDDNLDDDSEIAEDDEDSEEEEIESYESEAEYLKQFGIDGDSVDEILKDYATRAKQKSEPKEPEKLPDPSTTTSTEGNWKVGKNPVSSYIENLIKEGSIKDEGVADQYKSIAKVIDSGLGPELEKVNNMYAALAQPLTLVFNEIREASWRRFKYKNMIDSRDELDKIMNKDGLVNYEDAFRRKMINDQNLLSKFANATMKKGVEKANKKKPFKINSNRRSKPAPSGGSFNLKPYLNADGSINEYKLGALDMTTRKKVVDAYAKKLGVE